MLLLYHSSSIIPIITSYYYYYHAYCGIIIALHLLVMPTRRCLSRSSPTPAFFLSSATLLFRIPRHQEEVRQRFK